MRRFSTAAVVGLLSVALIAPPPAAAYETPSFGDTGFHLLHGRWMAISPFYGIGASQLGESSEGLEPRLLGLRYTERKGFVTGFFFAVINTIAGGMAAASPKSVRSYRSGNYIVTETTYRSEAEKQAMLAQTAAASAAMLDAEDQSFDLEIYSTALPGGGEASGHKLNMYFGISIADILTLDVGLGFGYVESRFERDGRQVALTHSYLGMPFRLNLAAGPLLIWFQWDWNWLGEWVGYDPGVEATDSSFKKQLTGSHLELGVTTALFDRVLLQAGLTTPQITSGDFGFRASVGFRF